MRACARSATVESRTSVEAEAPREKRHESCEAPASREASGQVEERKLDREALPEPDRTIVSRGFRRPGTPVEEVLAGICASLGLDRGVHDDCLRPGGTRFSRRRCFTGFVTLSARSFRFD